MSVSPDAPADKRQRTEEEELADEVQWISLEGRKSVTTTQMAQCWERVFRCKFPGWKKPKEGHFWVKGKCVTSKGKEERVCLNFWPNSGKWYFQGPDARSSRHNERWNKEFEKLFGTN